MKAGGRRLLWRKKVSLPILLLFSSLFFLAGFYGSIILSRDLTLEAVPRARFMELSEDREADSVTMPHGKTGESHSYSIPFKVLSWKPRAVYFPKFAMPKQCQEIIRIAKSKLVPSSLALRKGETVESTKGIRTSSGTFLSASEDSTEILKYIEEKIARATMIPRDHGEVASFLLYLSDVEEGGETMFPFEDSSNMDANYDYQKCIGLKVKPQQGDGLLFYTLMTNGTIDPTSLHGSCPVIKGEKWVATKWLRNDMHYN